MPAEPPLLVHLIAAARPNFMKVAPLYHALKKDNDFEVALVHTGQHYDANMSADFFDDLGLPPPDYHLGVGSGSHAEQTGNVMIEYEKICLIDRPKWIVVVGDVNPTAACTLVGAKLHIKVAHLEAGLRSGDRSMPEEINRIVTDAIADVLWTPSPDGDVNLLREGVPAERITQVGNIMLDSFEMKRAEIEQSNAADRLGFGDRDYAVVTLHRPSNVDNESLLKLLVAKLVELSELISIAFSVHPRTLARLTEFNLKHRLEAAENINLMEPVSYVPFMNLILNSRLVITDSGGLQEETTYLGIPCLTLRENTERPITITEGTNRLVTAESLIQAAQFAMADGRSPGSRPQLWDGKTAGRVMADLRRRSGMAS